MLDDFKKKYGETLGPLIIDTAESQPEIRKKLLQLSQLYAPMLLYPNMETITQLSGQALKLMGEIASACGLFEEINFDWNNPSQEKMQRLFDWMLETSPELSYYVEERVKKNSS